MAGQLKFLFLESFFGGSHREFAEGLISNSRHGIDLVTLPARYWKWRMRGAALYFIKKISSLVKYDGLITTDLMSLSDFKALAGRNCPPTLVYLHENQFTYPLYLASGWITSSASRISPRRWLPIEYYLTPEPIGTTILTHCRNLSK